MYEKVWGALMCCALVVGCAEDDKKLTEDDASAVLGDAGAPESEEPDAAVSTDAGAVAMDASEADVCQCTDPALPVCIVVSERCVECTDNQTEACPDDRPVCGIDNVCAECNHNGDCHDPSAPVCSDGSCTACTTNEECGDGRFCGEASGSCGECTKTELDNCKVGDVQNVCDTANLRCTELAVGSAKACEPCVSDAQCEAEHLCMETTFGAGEPAVGRFCLPKIDPTLQGLCSRPFVRIDSGRTSVDGEAYAVCSPAATTTCAALTGDSGYGRPCGVDESGAPVSAGQVKGDATLCGAPDLDDALCVDFGNARLLRGDFRCTVPCHAASGEECPALGTDGGSAPACVNTGTGGASGWICGL